MQPQNITHFWFAELTPNDHFTKKAALDEAIRTHFGATLAAEERSELFALRATPEGRLPEVLVLDQFSRNVYRGTPQALTQDTLAFALAQELVASRQDSSQPTGGAQLCLHALHAQRIRTGIHPNRRPVCATGLGSHPALRAAPPSHHRALQRRYIHRNAIMGCQSTPEDLTFLSALGLGLGLGF